MTFAGVEGEIDLLRVGGFDSERGSGTIMSRRRRSPESPTSTSCMTDSSGSTDSTCLRPARVRAAGAGLHGYSGNNNDMANNYGWRELADEEGFVVAFPNGTRDQWNQRFWDVDYAFHPGSTSTTTGSLLLAATCRDARLDPDRTFVTGFSNGAEMCFQLACRESATFRGFGPVIGMMLYTLWDDCNPEFLRPIITMNGTDDGVTLFEGDPNNTGGWGAYHSIPDMVEFWADKLETPDLERVFIKDTAPNDGSTVRLDRYSSDAHERRLWYYEVIGGGHDWPGQWGNMDIDATREVCSSRHRAREPEARPT